MPHPMEVQFQTAEELEAWLAALPPNEGSFYLVDGNDIRPLSFVRKVSGRIFLTHG